MYCIIRPTFAIPINTIKHFCLNELYLGFNRSKIKTTILSLDEVDPAAFDDKIQFYSNYIPWSKMLQFIVEGETFNSTETLIIKSLNYHIPVNISRLFGAVDPIELLFFVNSANSYTNQHLTPESIRIANRKFIEARLKFDEHDDRLSTKYNNSMLVFNLQHIIDNYRNDYIFYWNFKNLVV